MTVLTSKYITLIHKPVKKKSVSCPISVLTALVVKIFFCVQTLILKTALNNVFPVASNN